MSQSLIKKITFLIIFIIITASVWGLITFNGADKAVDDGTPGLNHRIDRGTFDGASMYLKSYSDVLILLNVYELSGVTDFDFDYAIRLTESAIVSLKESQRVYLDIVKIGRLSGPISVKSDALMAFDYDGFVQKNSLNKTIMERVKSYLGKGDLYGAFHKAVQDQSEILRILEAVHEKLERKEVPQVQYFWTLLQKYAESTLFGNYATLVFNRI